MFEFFADSFNRMFGGFIAPLGDLFYILLILVGAVLIAWFFQYIYALIGTVGILTDIKLGKLTDRLCDKMVKKSEEFAKRKK